MCYIRLYNCYADVEVVVVDTEECTETKVSELYTYMNDDIDYTHAQNIYMQGRKEFACGRAQDMAASATCMKRGGRWEQERFSPSA